MDRAGYHRTTTLFAALNTLDGSVISMCQPRRRHGEWLTAETYLISTVAVVEWQRAAHC